jgi:DNA-binding NtrC family response regulator
MTKSPWFLVVDPTERAYRRLTQHTFCSGLHCAHAKNGREALGLAHDDGLCAAIVEKSLPDRDGIEVASHLARLNERAHIYVASARFKPHEVVRAIRSGCHDVIVKPFGDEKLEEIEAEFRASRGRNDIDRPPRGTRLVGCSPSILEVAEMIESVAATDSTMLLRGQSGTGKELVARMIHEKSKRRDKAMICVNCAAIPEHLLEDELFGHVKGAFTGAIHDRDGRFELAHRSTIFLDEVGSMNPSLQVKLLRVLQDRCFQRVGENETRYVDVRIIAATSENLEERIAQQSFRKDLYYRLNVIPVHLPPLASRIEDLPVLVRHITDKLHRQRGMPRKEVSENALRHLSAYDWPGNVRELENVLERAVVLTRNRRIIEAEDLPPEILDSAAGPGRVEKVHIPPEGISFNHFVSRFEKRIIYQSLRLSKGNKRRAAEMLSLKRTTLVEKLKKYGALENWETLLDP